MKSHEWIVELAERYVIRITMSVRGEFVIYLDGQEIHRRGPDLLALSLEHRFAVDGREVAVTAWSNRGALQCSLWVEGELVTNT
jgi:hypothetical protein